MNNHLNVHTSIEALITAIPERPYPSGFTTFVDFHESFQEAQTVDKAYFGKTLSEISLEEILTCTDTAYLRAEAMVYFWPKILRAIHRNPDSLLARKIYYITVGLWNQYVNTVSESVLLKDLMNRQEKAATYAVLLAAREHVSDKYDYDREKVDEFLVHYRGWQFPSP